MEGGAWMAVLVAIFGFLSSADAGETAERQNESRLATAAFAAKASSYREKIATLENDLTRSGNTKKPTDPANALGLLIADYLHTVLDDEYERLQNAAAGRKGSPEDKTAYAAVQKERDGMLQRLEGLYSATTTFIHAPHPLHTGRPVERGQIRTVEYFATPREVDREELLKKACCRRTWGGLGHGETRKPVFSKDKSRLELFFETQQTVTTLFYLKAEADQKTEIALLLADKEDVLGLVAINNQIVVGTLPGRPDAKPARTARTKDGGTLIEATLPLRKGVNLVVVMTENLGQQCHDLGLRVEGRGLRIAARHEDAE